MRKVLPIITLFIITFLFLSPTSIHAANYYVSPNGNDNNSGSISSPWRTIQYAASPESGVIGGDTVYIREGTYYESIEQRIAGSPGRLITYTNYPNESPMIGDSEGDRRWRIIDKSYIRIEGLMFKDYSGGGILIGADNNDVRTVQIVNNLFENQINHLPDRGHHTIVVKVMWQETGRDHVYNAGVDESIYDILVEGNTIRDVENGTSSNHNEALTFSGHVVDSMIINNSIIRPNTIGIDIIGRLWNGQPENILIKGNSVSEHGRDEYASAGIYLDTPGENIVVEDNIISNGGTGIKSNVEAVPANHNLHAKRIIVRRNLVINNPANNFNIGRGRADISADRGIVKDLVVVHNTAYTNLTSTSTLDFGVNENLRVKNNIFSHQASEGKQYSYRDIIPEGVPTQTWDLNYNLFHSAREKVYQWKYVDYDGLESYRNASNKDQNSFEADPLFVDVASRDFRLRQDSPAIDAGGALTNTRSSGSGTSIPVNDARYFTDGFGLQDGDLIRVGNDTVRVTAVNYNTNTLTVDANISWNNNDPVNYDYAGNGPDIGAYESGYTSTNPTPTPNPSDLDNDGDVDILDQTILKNNFGSQSCGTVGDIDGNCKVDIFDYNILVSSYSR